MIFAIPSILLALAIVTALGPGIPATVRSRSASAGSRSSSASFAPPSCRSATPTSCVRGRCSGSRAARLLFRHILPSVYGVIAVQTSLTLAWAFLADASLSFLGLGPPPPAASLGRDGREVEQPGRHRLVDAGRTVGRDHHRGDRLQLSSATVCATPPTHEPEGADSARDRDDLRDVVRRDRSVRRRPRARRADARRRPAGTRVRRVPARRPFRDRGHPCRRQQTTIEDVCKLDTAIGQPVRGGRLGGRRGGVRRRRST